MTKFEWILRAQRQYAKRTNDWQYDWEYLAEVSYDESYEEFENEPEEAADSEMSYWSED